MNMNLGEITFYLPVSQNTFDSLSDNGVMLINILDPKVKGKKISFW